MFKKQGKGTGKATERNTAKSKEGKCSMEVVFILDRSGSMSGLEQDTIGGFNTTLNEHKQKKEDITWSTILFDHETEVIHDRMPIEQVKPLTEKEYYVRGCTALLDALGGAISHTASVHRHMIGKYVPEKTLFVITTDGMENSSREYSYAKVKKMISHEQEEYGWEFMFLGANIDAAAEAGRIGIRPEMAATYINDERGIAGNYAAVSCVMGKMTRDFEIDGTELDAVRRDFAKRGGRQ